MPRKFIKDLWTLAIHLRRKEAFDLKVIDTHCDALYKMQQSNNILNFRNSPQLQTNLKRLKVGYVKVQFFAIFLNPNTPSDKAWNETLEQIHIFQHDILEKNPDIIHITKWEQIHTLKQHEIGAVLALEGAESFGNDLEKLQQLYGYGVLSIGLTWNHANLCADGVSEPRGAGLTTLGKAVIRQNNFHKVLTDVAHLGEKGFWETIEIADYVYTSHANVRKICDHPRNLTDEQLTALFKKGGHVHLVFYPDFIRSNKKQVTIDHLIDHIDHICALGGEKNLGFGSDFDGIDETVRGLEHAGKYPHFIERLLTYFSEEQVRGFASENFMHYLHSFLAKS